MRTNRLIAIVLLLAMSAGVAAIVRSRWNTGVSTAAPDASLAPTSAGVSSEPRDSAASRCDALAGHPEDPKREAAGVADEDIMPEEAIAACLAATRQAPDNGRFQFELARAYWADMEYDDALDALLNAEALGYAPAYYYLGLAFEQGLTDEEPSDGAAQEMYLLAAAEGFGPAVRARAENSP